MDLYRRRMHEDSTPSPSPSPLNNVSETNQRVSGHRRPALVSSFIGVLVVAALVALGYTVWDLRQQVDDLEALTSSQSSDISDLERQVSNIDQFETYITESQLQSALRPIENEVDDLDSLLCGYSCSLVGSFNDVDQVLIDLTSCVNDFIDAWANNGRTFYC
jgi:hypothetical protein